MCRVTANGYFDAADNADTRHETRRQLNAQRIEDYRNGIYALAGGVIEPLSEDAPQFVKDYYAYNKTPRGYHGRSLNSNNGWNRTSSLSFLNMPLLTYAGEIQSAVLLVHGENTHSRYGYLQVAPGRQQAAAHRPRRSPHRPLRQPREDSLRSDRGILPRVP